MNNNIILSLSNLIIELSTRGFIHTARDISEVLHGLVIEDEKDDKKEEDEDEEDVAAHINGLRGDVIPEQPIGGFSIEPFFSDPGDLT